MAKKNKSKTKTRNTKKNTSDLTWTYGDSEYTLVKTAVGSPLEAISHAKEMGGYLVEVNDEAENRNLLQNVLKRFSIDPNGGPWGEDKSYDSYNSVGVSGGFGNYIWLGATDVDIEGDWRWINSNEKVDHSGRRAEWGEGMMGQEPDDNQYFGGQDFLALGLTNWPFYPPEVSESRTKTGESKDGEGHGNAGSWNDLALENESAGGWGGLYYVVEKSSDGSQSSTKSGSDEITSFNEIVRPSKFKKKFVDQLTNFDPSKDALDIDSDSFSIGDSVTFKVGKNSKSIKKLANENFDFLYDQRKGGLYFNENGADKGFGNGGINAILKGAPDLTSSNLEFV